MRRPFDADPDEFRLAAEALRIRRAASTDDMTAVATAKVTPLPHQIAAVYGELLPRIPLRFLLADDPGAGKTIMAGLYLKEMMLRSACERALIVAPGSLAEQWCAELEEKFDLHAEVLSRDLENEIGDPFAGHQLLVARMDQLAGNAQWLSHLGRHTWDVVIVDEAHRMSAHHTSWQGNARKTRRYELGERLSRLARHFLLMTATPHTGVDDDFTLFMRLLDEDRFEGRLRREGERVDTSGLMRRLVKEDMLTFEGTRLFPERVATTLAFTLSPAEHDLYEAVTAYVRDGMGRAQQLTREGEGRRGNAVGFALTLLQRRLASSPHAVLRSLERRRERLEEVAASLRGGGSAAQWASLDLPEDLFGDVDEAAWEWTDDERSDSEHRMDEILSGATAARSGAELEVELSLLDALIMQAHAVVASGTDTKWEQLRAVLDSEVLDAGTDGAARKLIVFTEHRDTLEHLASRLRNLLGRHEAVAVIHGGTPRAQRLAVCEAFTHDPAVQVLVATDAAGEGLNLHVSNLLVNFDLPWNPNRLEQRFGRIHRIGQRRTCHVWNLVAEDTREGAVHRRLLEKVEAQGLAYDGNLFHVLGEGDAFAHGSLKDLMLRAICEEDPERARAYFTEVVDASVADGLRELTDRRSLVSAPMDRASVREVRERMERARERRLQPGYVQAFFAPALARLGGLMRAREEGRFEITRTPPPCVFAA